MEPDLYSRRSETFPPMPPWDLIKCVTIRPRDVPAVSDGDDHSKRVRHEILRLTEIQSDFLPLYNRHIENPERILEFLHNCKLQWDQFSKILDIDEGPGRGHITQGLRRHVSSHEIEISKLYINLLVWVHQKHNKALDWKNLWEEGYNRMSTFRFKDGTAFEARTAREQKHWRSLIQDRYKVFEREPGKSPGSRTEGYCPVLHAFIPKKHGRAAHIVPHGFGPVAAEIVFKGDLKGKEILWDARNGLWIASAVELAMDTAQVALLPVEADRLDFDKQNYDIKLVVLDQRLLEPPGNKVLELPERTFLWNDLHNRTLDFRHALDRPARRYLLFHHLLATRRIMKQKPEGFEHRLAVLNTEAGDPWATPGSYFTRGLLGDLANTEEPAIYKADNQIPIPGNLTQPNAEDNEKDMQEAFQVAMSVSKVNLPFREEGVYIYDSETMDWTTDDSDVTDVEGHWRKRGTLRDI